ncbi:MAG: ABC transporter permease [Actinomycetota bacterium]|nr:ABC transporter permease [Actinomycetota bacterium]
MSDFYPFLVAGVVSGCLYGLAATGLVLTFKTSGIFNFAHGAVAALCAYCFHELRTVRGWPWPVALVLTVIVFAPLVGLGIELVARRLAVLDTTARIVATIGLLLAFQGLTQRLYGATPILALPFVSTDTFSVGGINVGYDQLTTIVISVVCVGALLLFFRRTRLGLEMRAVVDNTELLGLTGSSPVAVRRWAWAIGCAFAALSGVFLAPTVGLDATFLTLLVVQAFGAAAIGRFQNIGVTYLAAIGIGLVAELTKKYVPDFPSLAGVPSSLPFIVLFVVLVLSPAGRFRTREPRPRPYRPVVLPRSAQLTAAVGALVVLGFVPDLVGAKLTVYSNGAIFVILFVSLALLTRLSGQVSLCQMSFAAVGATTFSRLTVDFGLPWLPACIIAGLVVVPIGALLAIPAIRLSPLFLGLATFGFAILLERFVFSTFLMFGALGDRTGARPDVFGFAGERGFFYLCAGMAVVSVALAVVVGRSRLGRLLRGLADSPVGLVTHGADVNITRVIVFCISSFLAGVAGVLLLCLTGTARAGGTTFGFFQSLFLLAVLAISGRSIVVAPVIAALLLAVAPAYSTDPNLGAYQALLFGTAAVVAAVGGPAFGDYVRRAGPAARWRLRASPVTDRGRPAELLPEGTA